MAQASPSLLAGVPGAPDPAAAAAAIMLSHAARKQDFDEEPQHPNESLRRPLLSGSLDQALHHISAGLQQRRTASSAASAFASSELQQLQAPCLVCEMRARLPSSGVRDALTTRSACNGSIALELSRHSSLLKTLDIGPLDGHKPGSTSSKDGSLSDKEVRRMQQRQAPWTGHQRAGVLEATEDRDGAGKCAMHNGSATSPAPSPRPWRPGGRHHRSAAAVEGAAYLARPAGGHHPRRLLLRHHHEAQLWQRRCVGAPSRIHAARSIVHVPCCLCGRSRSRHP